MDEGFERYYPDMEAMHHGFRTEPCFVCRMVHGEIRLPGNIIYEDDHALVFLDAYPRAYSYTLVAPKEHREQVTGDFTMEEYKDLQRLVYRVSETIREEAAAARSALRGAARRLGQLEEGRAQDPQGGDGLTRRAHRSEGRAHLPSIVTYNRTSENTPSTHLGE